MSETVELVLIPAGVFLMGALPDDEDACDFEKPRHKVEITKAFYVGKYPVTQKLWEAVMGDNPSSFKGSDRPVENVSWFDCVEFCNKLSEREGKEPAYTTNGDDISCNWNANGYRLLSEAEWEYAARAPAAATQGARAKNQQYHLYSGSNNPAEVAWYRSNSGYETHPVGQKKPNGFGLYDMSGNVNEWVWDCLTEYSNEDQSNPTGASTGYWRLSRGGSWATTRRFLQVSYREGVEPTGLSGDQGFRIGRSR